MAPPLATPLVGTNYLTVFGRFKCYVMQKGVGGCKISQKNVTEMYGSTLLALQTGWVGVKFPSKTVT